MLNKQKFFLVLPLIMIPFLCCIFYVLGGGRGAQKTAAGIPGLNTELPKPVFDPKRSLPDKLANYEKASHDSMLRKENERRDPYLATAVAAIAVDSARTVNSASPHQALETTPSLSDARADELLRQLKQLKQSLDPSARVPLPGPAPVSQRQFPTLPAQPVVPPEADPQLDKLNGMLDKVIRIQHPESKPVTAGASNTSEDEVLPADSTVNSIAATVPQKQVLATGATIALRLTEDIRVNGIGIPRGQLIYGVVSINNDRMLIHISAIRSGRDIYTSDLQVYDLDGLPGIHIPGRISRDVAKESADQGLSSLSLASYDPSLGGQAANAGIQAAKSLFSRKVRQVRVTVPAGYQLLLRNTKMSNNAHHSEFPGSKPDIPPRLPKSVPGGPILQRFTTGGMEFSLQGIYLNDEVLWFALTTHNGSPITYIPEYTRWFIRDRRVFKSTAVQEVPLTQLNVSELSSIPGDSTQATWTGFRPFALAKDKELVIEMGEKNGGRTLTLVIRNKQILKAKKYETAK